MATDRPCVRPPEEVYRAWQMECSTLIQVHPRDYVEGRQDRTSLVYINGDPGSATPELVTVDHTNRNVQRQRYSEQDEARIMAALARLDEVIRGCMPLPPETT